MSHLIPLPFHLSHLVSTPHHSEAAGWVCISTSTASRRFSSTSRWWLPPTAGFNNRENRHRMQCNKKNDPPPGWICSSSALSTYPTLSSNANLSPGEPPRLKVEMKMYSLQTSLSLTSLIQGALIGQDNFAHVGSDETVS